MTIPIPSFLRKRTSLKILHHLLDDRRQKRRFTRGDRSTASGTILRGKDVEASIRYIEQEFRDYLAYGNISPGELGGKRILVVGPGDNLGVALLFLAHGGRKVVCLDKFEPERNPGHLAMVYGALRKRLPRPERNRFDEGISIHSGRDFSYNPRMLEYITGEGLEEGSRRFPPGSFDLIFSRAVLEHLYDPDRAFASMERLLATGGRMAHKIDLRDHEMFSGGEKHPLTFLTFPGWLWRGMTMHSGKPNRRLFPYYDRKMRELGYEYTLYITHIFGKEGDLDPHPPFLREGVDYDASHLRLVREIRGRLAREFRSYADEELLISGVFLSARKPDGAVPEATSSNSRS